MTGNSVGTSVGTSWDKLEQPQKKYMGENPFSWDKLEQVGQAGTRIIVVLSHLVEAAKRPGFMRPLDATVLKVQRSDGPAARGLWWPTTSAIFICRLQRVSKSGKVGS